MQLKEKPELNQINERSEFLAKTYQPYRPIKEPKSVARVDRTNLQPIKEPKSVAKIDRTNLQPIKEPKSVAKIDRPNLQPIKEPKSVAKVDRTNLKPIKEPKSVAKVDRTNLQPIKEPKSVATTEWPDLPPLKERKSVATTYQPYLRPIKESESVATTLLKIIFIHFPLAILKILFSTFSVVAIIMILAAIALPELGRCRPYKAMQSEAKQYLSSMNKGQQANYAEYSAFSNSLTALGLGIKTQTTNYNYSIGATKNAAFSYAVSRSNNLRSYVGAVFLVPVSPAANDAKTTVSILCQADSPGKTQPANPILQNDVPVCATGSSAVSK
jgi:type IV pilus assembly protein PilA